MESRRSVDKEIGRVSLIAHDWWEPVNIIPHRNPDCPSSESIRRVRTSESKETAWEYFQRQRALALMRGARLPPASNCIPQGRRAPDHVGQPLLAPFFGDLGRWVDKQNGAGIVLDEVGEDAMERLRSATLYSLHQSDPFYARLVDSIHDTDKVGRDFISPPPASSSASLRQNPFLFGPA